MTVQKGKDLLIKLDLTGTGQFETIAGLRATRITFNAETVDVTSLESAGGWGELRGGEPDGGALLGQRAGGAPLVRRCGRARVLRGGTRAGAPPAEVPGAPRGDGPGQAGRRPGPPARPGRRRRLYLRAAPAPRK